MENYFDFENLSLEEAKSLLFSRNTCSRIALALRTDLPEFWYSILALDPDSAVRFAVASNKSIPHDLQHVLSKSKDTLVIAGLCNNPYLCPEIIAEFVTTIEEDLLQVLLENCINIPPVILLSLSGLRPLTERTKNLISKLLM